MADTGHITPTPTPPADTDISTIVSELVVCEKQKLANIADAIREKTKTTDGIVLDEMAPLIAAIESGGKVATGTVIPSSDTDSDIDITHNLGEIPKLAIVYRELDTNLQNSSNGSKEVAFSYAIHDANVSSGYYYGSTRYDSSLTLACGASTFKINLCSSAASDTTGSCIHSCTNTTAKLYPIKNGTKKFIAGHRYRWILMTNTLYNK